MKKKTQSKAKMELLDSLQISEIKKATIVVRAIDNKFRQQVLKGLHQLGECSVTELYTYLKMQQEVCSIHLQSLRGIGLVTARREYRNVYYSINYDNLNLLMGRIKTLATQTELKVSSR